MFSILQALTKKLRQVEEDMRVQIAVASEEAKICQEQHESEAASWSFQRTTLEAQLSKQHQEAAAAAASFSTTIDQLNAQVLSERHLPEVMLHL
jgi:hypothetical protein